MSVMTPILRIRRVLRSIGATSQQSDDFADAMSAYPTKDDFQQRLDTMFAQQFNRIMFGIIVVVGLAVAIITVLMVALD
ncbi:MAG: hypothetical protein OXD50_07975 [Chloroflexi bacterium]|nr:hypothetical protein [Chloroflexota bacterium]